jgi:hypothetical protein
MLSARRAVAPVHTECESTSPELLAGTPALTGHGRIQVHLTAMAESNGAKLQRMPLSVSFLVLRTVGGRGRVTAT